MSLDSLKIQLLSDPEVKRHYEELEASFYIAGKLINLRHKLGLSQREMASIAKIKQPQLARIETGKQSPRLDTLISIASSVGYSVEINFVLNSSQE